MSGRKNPTDIVEIGQPALSESILSTVAILAALALAAVAIYAFWSCLNRNARDWPTVSDYLETASDSETKLVPESLYRVTVSDTEMHYTHPDGKEEIVEWDDLHSVDIVTTDQGPFLPDVFWILSGTQSTCMIAQGATGESGLIERLQALPGFDHRQMIDAMSSTSNQRFACWKRPTKKC